jgi:hypothetical protein
MTEEMTDEQLKAALDQWCATRDKHLIDEMTVKEWLAIRKEAGLKIDAETAEVHWTYSQTLDPYGIYTEPPDECWQVGREYFARSPGSAIWVHFGDLPKATRDAFWEKRRRKLAFPVENVLTSCAPTNDDVPF